MLSSNEVIMVATPLLLALLMGGMVGLERAWKVSFRQDDSVD